jgi:hypothetical protein
MRLRVATLLAIAILAGLGSASAQTRAADRVLAHNTLIQYVWAFDGDRVTRVDAVAGQTYWISVGAPPPPDPNHEPFTAHVDATPPGFSG